MRKYVAKGQMIVPSIIYDALCNVISALQYSFQLGIQLPTNSPSIWPLPPPPPKKTKHADLIIIQIIVFYNISKNF